VWVGIGAELSDSAVFPDVQPGGTGWVQTVCRHVPLSLHGGGVVLVDELLVVLLVFAFDVIVDLRFVFF